MITREKLIGAIENNLKSLNYINAFWLTGADCLRMVDYYSDIDLWVDIATGKETETINEIKSVLEKMAKIDFFFERKVSHPKIKQYILHLEGTSKFLVIDLCIQSIGKAIYYSEGELEEKPKIIFDRKNVVVSKHLNVERESELSERKKYLINEFKVIRLDVEKEIARKEYLGVVHYLSLIHI